MASFEIFLEIRLSSPRMRNRWQGASSKAGMISVENRASEFLARGRWPNARRTFVPQARTGAEPVQSGPQGKKKGLPDLSKPLSFERIAGCGGWI